MKKLLLILAFTSTFANAEFITGNQLKAALDAKENVAAAYIAGVVDALTTITICAPKLTMDQIIASTNQMLTLNQSNLDKPADLFIRIPLEQAYPCNRPNNSI